MATSARDYLDQRLTKEGVNFGKLSKRKPLDYRPHSLHRLVTHKYPDPSWIVEGLIHAGDQVVLAGPPKIGKSILVTQLALAAAKGEGAIFLKEQFKIPQKRRVLVLSFEMYEEVVAQRLRQHFNVKPGEPQQEGFETKGLDLNFVFGFNKQTSFDILDFERSTESKAKKSGAARLTDDGKALQELIQREKPDLVIFDTLIRVHSLDENNNVAMSHLLKYLREICSYIPTSPKSRKRKAKKSKKRDSEEVRVKRIAHVLVHHTRKDSGFGGPGKDARAVRGAGAIHAEADLVLTLSECYDKKTIMVSFSARRIPEPEDMYLVQSNFSFSAGEKPTGKRTRNAQSVAAAIWANLEKSAAQGVTVKEILEGVKNGQRRIKPSNFRNTYLPKIVDLLEKQPSIPGEKEVRYKLKGGIKPDDFHAAAISA